MNIRKHWKHLLLSSTALFWASCGGDSESSVSPLPDDPGSSETVTSSDSGTEVISSSSTAAEPGSSTVAPESSSDLAQSSSSTVTPESSSEATPSSSSKVYTQYGTFKMARDTSITCEVTGVFWTERDTRIKSPSELMDLLESNTTRSVESLEMLEDDLEQSLNYGVLYGSPSTTTSGLDAHPKTFECSNDSTYTTETHVGSGGYLYTKEEYKEKFPNQNPDKPSPLCQKTDFILCGGTPYMESGKERTFVGSLANNFFSDKETLIDSVKAANGDNLSDVQKNCLDSNIVPKNVRKDLDGGTTYINPRGPIATKQICDGDTTVNPRYQAKLDSNKAFIKKQIDECLGKDE